MDKILALATKNHKRALEIIKETRLIEIWQDAGAEVNIVGSVKTGLLVTHLDIDLHVYSPRLDVASSFTAMSKLAACNRIKKIEYTNLTHTDEACIEWHAWYEDIDRQLWQLDIIHIEKGSFFDGHAEKLAERLILSLTEETRNIILKLKYETPENKKITSVEYYKAVIEDGIKTYHDFMEWRKINSSKALMLWLP